MKRNANLTWLSVFLYALFVLLPWGYAALSGAPDPQTAGFARLWSAARQVICGRGWTPFLGVALTLGALLALMVAAAPRVPRLGALRQDGTYLLVLALLTILPFLIAWQTDSSACNRGRAFFWQSVYVEIFILAALAISYNLMFGFTGVVSFGHAAFFGLGAYGVGLLMKHLGWNLGAALLVTLLVSALLSALVSVIALRIRGLYFAIFTLAFAELFYILAQNRILVDITGAEDGFTFAVPDWVNAVKNRLLFYYLGLGLLVLAFWFVRRLVNSPAGRVMAAVRENEDRALMLGYNTFAFKTLSIVSAGMLATLAGALRGLLNKGASPNVLGLNFTMDPLLMTLIGGTGTFSGPAVGAFLLRLTEQLLRDTVVQVGGWQVNLGERWALLLGLLFILSVMVFPQGIVGTVQAWRARRAARRTKNA
ncbi:MAG: hypothetical protein Fur0018_27820 [Anaerolineales bacterium]